MRFVIGAVATALGARAAACEPPTVPQAPAIAVDARGGAMVAWEELDPRDGSTLYLRRLDARAGVTTVRGGTVIARFEHGALFDPPEIVAGRDGGLVLIRRDTREPVAIPFDRDGAVTGAPQPFAGCAFRTSHLACFDLCRRPVAIGDRFVVAHRYGLVQVSDSSLMLSTLDARGVTVANETVPRRATVRGCALAARGDQLVIATSEGGLLEETGVHVVLRSAAGATTADVWIPSAANVVAAAADRDGAWVLVAERGAARVLLVTEAGLQDTIALPADVDPASADLAVAARGPYVTWLSGGRTHRRGLGAGAPDRRERAGRTPAGTRTAGTGDRCVVAWSEDRGRRLRVAGADRCP